MLMLFFKIQNTGMGFFIPLITELNLLPFHKKSLTLYHFLYAIRLKKKKN